ncbi:MAG: class I SAM-dependent methyltransferase [Planctomycetota bacterium]|jgi:SAM-dependent methyltransferase|nr:class I SAM-dependent methyltransferase [Planctomycetota bacterium]
MTGDKQNDGGKEKIPARRLMNDGLAHGDPDGINSQSRISENRNREFFAGFVNEYQKQIDGLDGYINIRRHLDCALRGVRHLCDVGNGGVFDYDVAALPKITAVDLFFAGGRESNPNGGNMVFVRGSALELPFPDGSFDGALLSMLLHHLTGESVAANQACLDRALREAHRVLQVGGKCVVLESCLPNLVYRMEQTLYPLSKWLITRCLTHPPTFQYSLERLAGAMEALFGNCSVQLIPRGRWQIFLGAKLPSILLPTWPVLFESNK